MSVVNKDSYYMSMTKLIASRSTCVRRNVGAVLVKNDHIIATGFNGTPKKIKHCTKESCPRKNFKSGRNREKCRGICAEVNCIIQAALHGTSIKGNTTLYSTNFPCIRCLKLIINAEINRLVFFDGYFMDNEIKQDLIKESNVEIINFKELIKI